MIPRPERPRKNTRLHSRPSAHNLIRTLSKRGLCSRSQALSHVQAGRVTVNGKCVTDPGYKVRPHDKIQLAGETAKDQAKRYFLFHKPAGCVTTRSDEKGRKTIYDYLSGMEGWVFPVGRLDLDSEGLLILTNDTVFGNKLTDPSFKVPRVYEVWVKGRLEKQDQAAIHSGVDIGCQEKSQGGVLKILEAGPDASHAEITLTEGKNREVRRIFEVLGKPVTRLLRTRFGPFQLGGLKSGTWKEVFLR